MGHVSRISAAGRDSPTLRANARPRRGIVSRLEWSHSLQLKTFEYDTSPRLVQRPGEANG
jgi:hypothetical protein